jgi:hypothetical protein
MREIRELKPLSTRRTRRHGEHGEKAKPKPETINHSLPARGAQAGERTRDFGAFRRAKPKRTLAVSVSKFFTSFASIMKRQRGISYQYLYL